MSDSSQGSCRRCQAQVYWFKSFKTGKSYCCDTDDRRDFHKCQESAQPKPTTSPAPITPDYFSATVEERVAALEKQVAQLTRTLRAVEQRQRITSEDIPF